MGISWNRWLVRLRNIADWNLWDGGHRQWAAWVLTLRRERRRRELFTIQKRSWDRWDCRPGLQWFKFWRRWILFRSSLKTHSWKEATGIARTEATSEIKIFTAWEWHGNRRHKWRRSQRAQIRPVIINKVIRIPKYCIDNLITITCNN